MNRAEVLLLKVWATDQQYWPNLEVVRNADSQAHPGPIESKSVFEQAPWVIHLHINVRKA